MELKKNWSSSWQPKRFSGRVSAITVLSALLLGSFLGCVPIQEPVGVHEQSEALRLIDQGTALLRRGDFDQAEAAFQVAFEIVPTPAALDGLGCIAFLRGRPEVAERYFVQAYNLDPTYTQALGNLALLYESRGLTAKAKSLYEQAILRDPQNFRARNNYAGFLIQTQSDTTLRNRAHQELLRAQALVAHPLIDANITKQGIQ